MTITLKVPTETTPCFSADPEERKILTAMFSSTATEDHAEAAFLCRGCPFRAACQAIAEETAEELGEWFRAPEGTWGGQLWRRGHKVDPC